MRRTIAAIHMLLALGFLGQHLLAEGPSSVEIAERMRVLQDERQDLLSQIQSLERQVTSSNERVSEIDLILQGLEAIWPSAGISTHYSHELNLFSTPKGTVKGLMKEIPAGEEFLVQEADRERLWWRVTYQGASGFVLFDPDDGWLPEEDVNELAAMLEVRQAQEREVDIATRAREAETQQAAEEERKRAERELLEERKAFGPGKWKQSRANSPIDDSPTVVLRLNAEKAVATKWGSRQPTLIVRCQQNRTNVYLDWDFFLGTDSIRVITRLDKEPASTNAWSISTDNEAAFSATPIPLTKSLWSHDTLFVQLTPYGESPVSTTFDLRGLASQVNPLREACHW